MRVVLFPLFLVLFGFGWVSGQQAVVSGTVSGEPDKDAVSGARVILDNSSGTLTDTSGAFRLSVDPGEHVLEFRSLGFVSQKKKLNLAPGEQVELDILLKLSAKTADIVVISSSQYEKSIAEETVSMDVIDRRLITNINPIDIGEAIDKSVGVQVQEGQVSMRGGSSWSYGVGSRTAVLVDGLNFMSAELGEAQLRFAPTELADRIEVIKGAASVVYGSSALNGVVNVLTRWPNEGQQTEFTVWQGVYGNPPRPELQWWPSQNALFFSGVNFYHGRKKGPMEVVVGGNITLDNNFLQDSDQKRGRINFKTRYHSKKVKGLHFGVNGNVMRENSGRFYLAADLDTNAYRKLDGAFDEYLRVNVDPHITYVSPKGHRHRLVGRWLNVWRYGNTRIRDVKSNIFFLDYQWQKRYGERWVLTGGVPLSYGYAVSNLFEGKKFLRSGAAYIQGEFKNERFSWVSGVRYEFSSVDVVFSTGLPVFRTGINWQAGEGTWLRTSWGQAYRLPTVGERFINVGFSILQLFPDPNLQPEKGWGYEIGLKQAINILDWQGFFDFSLFMNEYEDFVEYRIGIYNPPGEPPTLQWLGLKPFNIERARVAGFEASLLGRGNLGPVEFRTLLGYTYNYPGDLDSDTTQRDLGVYLKNAIRGITTWIEDDLDDDGNIINERTASIFQARNRHLLKGDLEFFYNAFSVGGTVYYISFPEKYDQFYFAALPGLDIYSDRHRYGDWAFGLRGGYKLNDKIKTMFIVKNITNREYFQRPGRLEAPRNYTLQLQVKL